MSKLKFDIQKSFQAKKSLIKIENKINKAILLIYNRLIDGGKILLCGNGGSAADAQHLAAEFLIRLRPNVNRKPIAALTLAQDTSTITACGNDYNFEDQFARCLEGIGKENDVLIAISTSGNSKNIIKVLKQVKKMNILSIGFLGNMGGLSKKFCDISLIVNSKKTARIQEAHIFLGHYIFEKVEKKLISNSFI